MDSYFETITPQVGDKWHADEVWLKMKGDRKYLFVMMDNETRFWISQEVADNKFRHNIQNLLKKGKEIAKKIHSEFVTDGLPASITHLRKSLLQGISYTRVANTLKKFISRIK